VAPQLESLGIDTRLQRTMSRREFQRFRVHSGRLPRRRNSAMSSSSSLRLALNILLG
jgi:hypothetical protein